MSDDVAPFAWWGGRRRLRYNLSVGLIGAISLVVGVYLGQSVMGPGDD